MIKDIFKKPDFKMPEFKKPDIKLPEINVKNPFKKEQPEGDRLERVNIDRFELLEDFRDLTKWLGRTYRDKHAFMLKDKLDGQEIYRVKTYEDFAQEVSELSAAFKDDGILDEPVALTGKNCYEWVLVYFAVLYGGGVIVPLDKDLPDGETESLFDRSHSGTIVYHKDRESGINAIKEKNHDCLAIDFDFLKTYIEKGKDLLAKGYKDHEVVDIDPDKMAILLFTSGTTAQSKGVMLSHRNIIRDAFDTITSEDLRTDDINMALLPYHHTFGCTGQIIALWGGLTTVYCDGLRYLQKNMKEYNVTVFVGVPALVEAIYRKLMAGVKKKGKDKALAGGLLMSKAMMAVGVDKRRDIFSDVIAELGNLRLVITGASAIDPDVVDGFNDMGILCLQGYGLTESSPIISAESREFRRSGSVGKPMPSVDVKLIDVDEDGVGELLAKGPNIMLGYFENEEATAEALTDGWLHTGDLASIDKDGYIFIRGRKKNVIVLKNGKNVYPEELEKLIESLPFVKQVLVYGQNKNDDEKEGMNLVVSCKIVYDKDYLEKYMSATTQEEISEVFKEAIDKVNHQVPEYARIKRLELTEQPMAMTSTGKIKRYQVLQN